MPEIKGDIVAKRFVLETRLMFFPQPFVHNTFRLSLVVRGTGTLIKNKKSHPLKEGSVFFCFPSEYYNVKAKKNFSIYYIDYIGEKALSKMVECGISKDNCVFHGLNSIEQLFNSAIKNVYDYNANVIVEGVLLHALGLIAVCNKSAPSGKERNPFISIVNYVNSNYSDKDLSLKKIADRFSYSEKHVSYLFTQNLGVGFSKFLNGIRIQRSAELLGQGIGTITEISVACGFSDPLYFSKLFKKNLGVSPSDYLKENTKIQNKDFFKKYLK